MTYPDDPRVFFAAERTVLAWVRTGIATMGLGFVVARFGIFLKYLMAQQPALAPAHGDWSAALGVGLALAGSGMCLVAGLQFRRFARRLTGPELPPRWCLGFSTAAAFAMAGLGLVVALYLMS
jgi:putative membrane protein